MANKVWAIEKIQGRFIEILHNIRHVLSVSQTKLIFVYQCYMRKTGCLYVCVGMFTPQYKYKSYLFDIIQYIMQLYNRLYIIYYTNYIEYCSQVPIFQVPMGPPPPNPITSLGYATVSNGTHHIPIALQTIIVKRKCLRLVYIADVHCIILKFSELRTTITEFPVSELSSSPVRSGNYCSIVFYSFANKTRRNRLYI